MERAKSSSAGSPKPGDPAPSVVVDAFEAAPAPVDGAQGQPPVMLPFDDEGGPDSRS